MKKRRMSKVIWLSSHKLVFESPSKMDFSYDDLCEIGLYGKRKVLIVAELGRDLRFLEGNGSMPDELCWFCEHGISPFLVSGGGCLLNANSQWTKFCRNFSSGHPFGQSRRTDMGERRRRAEKILSRIISELPRDSKELVQFERQNKLQEYIRKLKDNEKPK